MPRLVIAEDEDGLRAFLAEALVEEGLEIEAVSDGEQALAAVRRASTDVLLTDLKMPRLDGSTLLRTVRAEFPEVQVIVLTAYGTVGNAVEAIRAGAADYLQKPLRDPTELRLVVRQALERRAFLDLKDREALGQREIELTWGAPAMREVVNGLRKVAPTQATVLLAGESGTGKEVAARAVHAWSSRRSGPFVAVNCAALSPALLESELFGHERGAFTGAESRRRGRLELASGGTFFLDEVGELARDLQAKLLRVLQERAYERVGGHQTLRAEVRWIAATNRDLEAMMKAGSFREDLFHRLAVFPVRMLPLRDRREDLLPLARRLLVEVAADLGRLSLVLDPAGERALMARAWPGNIRELRNALERAAILSDGELISAAHLAGGAVAPSPADPTESSSLNLEALERDAIVRALDAAEGNRKRAADLLGIGERTLYDRLKRLGIK